MTKGIGGAVPAEVLNGLTNMTTGVEAISPAEYYSRIAKAQHLMQQQGLAAVYLNAGTNLYYFTGTRWPASERLVGAIIPASGPLHYIAPAFEVATLNGFTKIKADIHCWEEHESPYELVATLFHSIGIDQGVIGIDESTPFFVSDGLRDALTKLQFCNGTIITAACRMEKSAAEIALMQKAKDMTLVVHQATASILHDNISTGEVTAFINEAHKAVGATSGSYFCIVLFGEDSAFPHGVATPNPLRINDMVLIDTGCQIEGYMSDITRSYVYGEPSDRQRQIWQLEQRAQLAAFNAAQVGISCGAVDAAARQVLAQAGFGPDYQLPGLPHRTGHGIGLDIHEWPYLVKGNTTALTPGMCFSNEPMLCVPGEFGVRLEDHFYMTEAGPRWFTQPSTSIDDPFGIG
ncbi:MAG: Xaa-Pro dipeptidase [Granulosicoccus sp.]|jgi:Xaa-Pro dipeptidase